jgi:hypothetical protein
VGWEVVSIQLLRAEDRHYLPYRHSGEAALLRLYSKEEAGIGSPAFFGSSLS